MTDRARGWGLLCLGERSHAHTHSSLSLSLSPSNPVTHTNTKSAKEHVGSKYDCQLIVLGPKVIVCMCQGKLGDTGKGRLRSIAPRPTIYSNLNTSEFRHSILELIYTLYSGCHLTTKRLHRISWLDELPSRITEKRFFRTESGFYGWLKENMLLQTPVIEPGRYANLNHLTCKSSFLLIICMFIQLYFIQKTVVCRFICSGPTVHP